mmetsp:Transcript_24928/g.53768  ORF Transcript_24928/g.53768 Transcript_24928/m.53768 type:complete len:201 (+) Transcript_24928:1628-2230(+)
MRLTIACLSCMFPSISFFSTSAVSSSFSVLASVSTNSSWIPNIRFFTLSISSAVFFCKISPKEIASAGGGDSGGRGWVSPTAPPSRLSEMTEAGGSSIGGRGSGGGATGGFINSIFAISSISSSSGESSMARASCARDNASSTSRARSASINAISSANPASASSSIFESKSRSSFFLFRTDLFDVGEATRFLCTSSVTIK